MLGLHPHVGKTVTKGFAFDEFSGFCMLFILARNCSANLNFELNADKFGCGDLSIYLHFVQMKFTDFSQK